MALSKTGIARICHEINRAYCESLGDFSQKTWEEAPEWQRKSAINGVTFHEETPDAKPSDSHTQWMKEKLDSGWKYGLVKDAEKKEHPCLVPFDELPQEQKTKDFLFAAVVRSLK